ncbi:mechanosensitive ion channel family protein [Caproiciproducens sp. LBM24188]
MGVHFEKTIENFLHWLQGVLPQFLGALLILGLGWWLSNVLTKLICKGMSRGGADSGIVSFICSLLRVVFKIIVVIMAAQQLGLNVTSLIAALTTAGVAIGLALKDNMANIAGGAQIIFTKPFRGGDYIALQNVEGTVERIEIMFTVLRTFDNKEIVIPNSKITDSVITNYSARATRRLDLNYQVGYGDNLSKVKQTLLQLSEEHGMVLNEPAPQVLVGEYKEDGIVVSLKVWCRTEDYWTLYSDLQERVKAAFQEEGIELPFRRLDIHMDREE